MFKLIILLLDWKLVLLLVMLNRESRCILPEPRRTHRRASNIKLKVKYVVVIYTFYWTFTEIFNLRKYRFTVHFNKIRNQSEYFTFKGNPEHCTASQWLLFLITFHVFVYKTFSIMKKSNKYFAFQNAYLINITSYCYLSQEQEWFKHIYNRYQIP